MATEKIYGEQDFYRLAELLAIKFFTHNKEKFLEIGQDVDDLKQEARIVVYNLLKNTNFSGVSLPLVKKGVMWKLKHIRNNYNRDMKGISFVPLDEVLNEDTDNPRQIMFEFYENLPTATKKPLFSSPLELFKTTFSFDQIKSMLKPKEYQIIEERLRGKNTFALIGEKRGISKQMVDKIYRKSLLKLRKRLLERTK